MLRIISTAVAAFIVLAAGSFAHADDYAIDQRADAIRNHGPIGAPQILTTRPVAQPTEHLLAAPTNRWMDRNTQNFGPGF
jgi:hypothetical protein